MSTKTQAVTSCDGPGCSAEHHEGEHAYAPGWLSVAGDETGDFCGMGCLATWAMALARSLTVEEPDGG